MSQPVYSQDVGWFQANYEWYYSVDCFSDPGCGYSHYTVGNDTLLGGVQGAGVQISMLEESGSLTIDSEMLRFSDDTVFRYSPEAERWHMIYDLGALPGDVWNIQDEEFLGYADEGFPDSLFRVVVDSVDVMEVAGEERRLIYSSAWADGGNSSQFHFGYEGFILEGVGPVGDARSLIGQSVASSLVPHPAQFQCFLTGGEMVFGSSASPCNLLSTTVHFETESLSIHPNPTRGPLFFDMHSSESEIAHITIFDLKGHTIMSGRSLDKSLIDVGTLPAGVYVLEIITRDSKRSIGKFVKT